MTPISHLPSDEGSLSAGTLASALVLCMVLTALASFDESLAVRSGKAERSLVELIHESNSQTLADYPIRDGGSQ